VSDKAALKCLRRAKIAVNPAPNSQPTDGKGTGEAVLTIKVGLAPPPSRLNSSLVKYARAIREEFSTRENAL